MSGAGTVHTGAVSPAPGRSAVPMPAGSAAHAGKITHDSRCCSDRGDFPTSFGSCLIHRSLSSTAVQESHTVE